LAAIDTNVLVRIITRDHPEQTAKAQAFVAGQGEAGVYVAPMVLAETAWVLERAYRWKAADIHQALHITAHCGAFRLDDTCHNAIDLYQREGARGVGFSDCLILQTVKDKHQGSLATFDQRLGILAGTTIL
jgi:predicted nucleic-acid-binding protein